MDPTSPWLIVGLGNPGSTYENTPHNLGFQVVDCLARRHRWEWREEKKFRTMVAKGTLHDQDVRLLKPMTFMNLSGEAVLPYLRYYKIELPRLIVVCDDVALPMGRMRLRKEGTDAGQKGLRNIIQHAGHPIVARLRIGIDPDVGRINNLASFVLAKMQGAYKEDAALMVEKAVDCIEFAIGNGMDKAMSLFNAFDAGKASE